VNRKIKDSTFEQTVQLLEQHDFVEVHLNEKHGFCTSEYTLNTDFALAAPLYKAVSKKWVRK
jgi:hypothetical protein